MDSITGKTLQNANNITTYLGDFLVTTYDDYPFNIKGETK